MVKIEIELTDEQYEKVEILKSKDTSVGEAIDLLFKLQNEALSQMKEQHGEEKVLEKLQETNIDKEIREELMKRSLKENETYDRALQDAKHSVKWSKFFKF